MPTEFVRVRDKSTNTESSLPRRRAEQLAGRGDVEILDKERAVNAFGEPLPATTADNTATGSGSTDGAPSAGQADASGPKSTTRAKSKEQTR